MSSIAMHAPPVQLSRQSAFWTLLVLPLSLWAAAVTSDGEPSTLDLTPLYDQSLRQSLYSQPLGWREDDTQGDGWREEPLRPAPEGRFGWDSEFDEMRIEQYRSESSTPFPTTQPRPTTIFRRDV